LHNKLVSQLPHVEQVRTRRKRSDEDGRFIANLLLIVRLLQHKAFNLMHVLGTALALFLFAFALHWFWWRLRIPRRQSAVLLLIFTAALPIGLAIAWFRPLAKTEVPWNFWSLAHISVFHVSMALAYVVTYSGLEERSPSMSLLLYVAESRTRGRTQDELYAILSGATPIETRLQALVRDRMIEQDGDVFRITSKGRLWAIVFGAWRRLLGMKKGG